MGILNLILSYIIGFGPIIVVLLLLLAGGLVFIWVGITRPQWIAFTYLAILVCFTGSGYGNLEVVHTIYTRGSGQLFFSFVVWGLVAMCFFALVYTGYRQTTGIRSNLRGPYIAMAALFIVNLAIAPLLGVNIKDALSNNGIINLIFLGFLFFVLLSVVGRKKDIDILTSGLMVLIAVRGIYGLVRLAFWGGDPSNVYSNFEHINVKITYFDICDSLLACVGAIYALRRLLSEWSNLGMRTRILLTLFALLELVVIILSYRRTAWSGLAIALLFLIAVTPTRQRWLPLLATPLLVIGISMIAMRRLSINSNRGGFFESFFYDLTAKNNWAAETARTLELKYATASALNNPIFGEGIWGRYEGYGAIPWQTGTEAYSFVHSSPIHLLLKTGVVGLGIVSIALFLFIRFVWTARKLLAERDRYLFDASLAGLLFLVPDFFIGTPITQFRITQLYALLMATPYLVVAITGVQTDSSLTKEI